MDARTTAGTWTIHPAIHQDTKIVLEGRGMFGLIAEVSTAPADYGQANTEFIVTVTAHTVFPALLAELSESRRQLAARRHRSTKPRP